jgi:hypothetical protein
MKKYLYWPYVIIFGIILVILVIPMWLGMLYNGIVSVLIELFDRGEWWICGRKRSYAINNPWDYSLKEAFLSAFNTHER